MYQYVSYNGVMAIPYYNSHAFDVELQVWCYYGH